MAIYRCSNYVQGADMCQRCIRNVGFMTMGANLWKHYEHTYEDASRTQLKTCEGYKEKI